MIINLYNFFNLLKLSEIVSIYLDLNLTVCLPIFFRKFFINSILDIIYLSNLNKYKNYATEICTKICFTLKKLFIGQLYFKKNRK